MPPEIRVTGPRGSFTIVDANENTVPGDAGDRIGIEPATPENLETKLKAVGISSEEWRNVRYPALKEYLKIFKHVEEEPDARVAALLLEGVRIFAGQTGIEFDETRAVYARNSFPDKCENETKEDFEGQKKIDEEMDRWIDDYTKKYGVVPHLRKGFRKKKACSSRNYVRANLDDSPFLR